MFEYAPQPRASSAPRVRRRRRFDDREMRDKGATNARASVRDACAMRARREMPPRGELSRPGLVWRCARSVFECITAHQPPGPDADDRRRRVRTPTRADAALRTRRARFVCRAFIAVAVAVSVVAVVAVAPSRRCAVVRRSSDVDAVGSEVLARIAGAGTSLSGAVRRSRARTRGVLGGECVV